MAKWFERISVRSIWAVSCLIILIFPFVANILMLRQLSTNLHEEIGNTYYALLNGLGTTVDNALTEANGVAVSLSSNTYLSNLLQTKNDTDRKYASFSLSNTLYHQLHDNCRYSIRLFIYFPEWDLIVANDFYGPTAEYYQKKIAASLIPYDEWIENLTSAQSVNSIWNSSAAVELGDGYRMEYDTVEFAKKLTPPYTTVKAPILCASIRRDLMFPLSAGNAKQPVILVTNRKNLVLIRSGDIDESFLQDFETPEEYQPVSVTLGGEPGTIWMVRSKRYTYQYYYLLPYQPFQEKAQAVLYLGLIVNGICLVLSGLTCVLFIRWNDRQMKLILRRFSSPALRSAGPDEKNEYVLIKRRVESSLRRQQEMEQRISAQSAIVRNSFLSNLLKGYIHQYENLDEWLRSNQIEFPCPLFAVVSIYPGEIGAASNAPASTGQKKLFLSIQQALEAAMGPYRPLLVDMDGISVGIFNFGGESVVPFRRDLSAFAELASKLAEESFETTLGLALSCADRGVNALPALYRQTASVMEYQAFYGLTGLASFDELQTESRLHQIRYDPAKLKTEWVVCLKTNDPAGAEQILSRLFEENSFDWPSAKLQVKSLAYNIVSTFGNIAEELELTEARAAFSGTESFEPLETCSSVEEYRRYLAERLQLLFRAQETGVRKSSSLYDRIKDYVDQNFTDPMMNVSSVAEEFQMSSLYISRVFKQFSGNKLVDYINRLRIGRAKRLMRENRRITVEEITAQAGYANTRTFLNAFKHYEGVTPSQYKKSIG